MRLPGRPARHRDTGAGARAVRVAPHHAAADRAPVPVHRVRARVASGHHRRGRATGQDLPRRAALGAGRHRGPAPVHGPRRRRTRRLLEHRPAILTPPGPLHLVPHRITAASPLRTPDPEEPI
ncbi:hypothetical protein CDES_14455 (plasmid) [Corynebacterium deserti GIMN1.010]|uniref:Uncharacterized protein n=1 Tax=Corynebacterium deserti GIMN1.010 TaxID=931089 RepID=A0A0M4CP63_9CORY|nr:hypothetical protein CDES_14455 [Corynebacterium deserti GIMN1.010]